MSHNHIMVVHVFLIALVLIVVSLFTGVLIAGEKDFSGTLGEEVMVTIVQRRAVWSRRTRLRLIIDHRLEEFEIPQRLIPRLGNGDIECYLRTLDKETDCVHLVVQGGKSEFLVFLDAPDILYVVLRMQGFECYLHTLAERNSGRVFHCSSEDKVVLPLAKSPSTRASTTLE